MPSTARSLTRSPGPPTRSSRSKGQHIVPQPEPKPPMTPRPDDQARAEPEDPFAKASERRATERERVETEFWQEIDHL